MGCGGSKFDAEGDAVPARVRPLLRRRIEDIKRRRNANGLKDSTPSKKELLHNNDVAGEEDDDNDITPSHSLHEEDGCKNVSSPDPVKITKVHVQEEEERSLIPEKEESKTGDKEKSEEAKSIADSEEDDNDDDDDEGEYDEEGMHGDDKGYICPGSPSFRVYYVESLANKNDNDDDDGKNEAINESSQGDESIASTNSTEGSVTKSRKKGNKGRRFRRVMHKGGHVAVKNLKSVKSCYNPAASSQDNTGRLLQKSPA